MAITQVWDSSYENIPADNDQASEGALRIRNLKRDIRERIEVDHDWDDTTDAGKHLQVTFRDPLGAKPSAVADEGYLYTKDVSAKAELHWEDEDGNEIQLSTAGKIPEASLQAKAFFPSTTAMVFYQDSAPTGWTIVSAVDEHGIRLTKGSVAGGQAGGARGGVVNFSTVFGKTATDSHTLTTSQMPAHTHTGDADWIRWTTPAGDLGIPVGTNSERDATAQGATGSTGGGTGHTHNIDIRLKWAACVVCTKD